MHNEQHTHDERVTLIRNRYGVFITKYNGRAFLDTKLEHAIARAFLLAKYRPTLGLTV